MATIISDQLVWWLFDVFMLAGTSGLGICYVWARYLGHVDTFCDISDLVVNLPERILFRMNFSLVGGFLALIAFPICHMTSSRVGGKLPAIAAFFQVVSGLGVVLVGACGPEEIISVHITAAVMGFGGSAIAQIVYNFVFYTEDKATQPDSAPEIFGVRCTLSVIWLVCVSIYGLAELGIFPEPTEHIMEWSLWFVLMAWYFTFKWDLKEFYVGAIEGEDSCGHLPLLPKQKKKMCFVTA